ncbi:MAG: oligoribonuclease, partial [Gammaproteobacteria bacterium]
ALRWAPEVARSLRKESAHRALADIEESVAELRHYRALLFRPEWGG